MKDDLTIMRGGYRMITISAAAELVGYQRNTIEHWHLAGAIGECPYPGKKRRVLVSQEDVVTVAGMEVKDLHDIGIYLSPEEYRQQGRAAMKVRNDATRLEAERHRDSWTADDLAIIGDPDLTLTEMAKRTKRTYIAVMQARLAYDLERRRSSEHPGAKVAA